MSRCKLIGTMSLALVGSTVLSVQSAQASSVSAFASCFVSNVDNSQQTSTTPGAPATATLPAPHACVSSGTADYGILRLGSTITGTPQFTGSVFTQFGINFTLSDPNRPANTPITLQIPVQYDVTISVTPGGIGSQANSSNFEIYLGGNVSPFWLYRVSTSTDSLGNENICPSPLPTFPRCNGRYQGTATAFLETFVNGGMQRLGITANGGVVLNTAGTAIVDALNTVTLGNVILPNGVTYTYDSDINGNPAHFTYAGPAAVPEPSTWSLLAGGLGILLAVRRRVRA